MDGRLSTHARGVVMVCIVNFQFDYQSTDTKGSGIQLEK